VPAAVGQNAQGSEVRDEGFVRQGVGQGFHSTIQIYLNGAGKNRASELVGSAGWDGFDPIRRCGSPVRVSRERNAQGANPVLARRVATERRCAVTRCAEQQTARGNNRSVARPKVLVPTIGYGAHPFL